MNLCITYGIILNMVKINIKYFMWLICMFALLIYFCIYFAFGHNNEPYSLSAFLGDCSKVVMIMTLLSSLFISFAWKWRIFRGWLISIPDISGKWEGKLISTYINPPMEIPTTVYIKQTFFHTIVKIQTGESSSISKCASFDIDSVRGVKHLYYSYVNKPKAEVRNRSEIHYGTTLLEISEDNQSMTGEYWTSRKTTGSIDLRKCS